VPEETNQPEELETQRISRLERSRQRVAVLEGRAQAVAERAQRERGRHRSVDALFEMVDRDSEVGGGIIAGALAFRLFIWLLPLALVAVAGLGIAARESAESPQAAARALGLTGLVTHSVATAAKGGQRWYALAIGIPILIFATRSVLRVLIGTHRLVWGDLRVETPKPKLGATLRLLVLILGYYCLAGFATWLRASSGGLGLILTLAVTIGYAGFWLLVSLRLPHHHARWTALIPGALLFGIGAEVLQLVALYLVAPYSLEKEGTYGALGLAAGLMLGLFFASRLIVSAAIVNATLWERKATSRDGRPEPMTGSGDAGTTGKERGDARP
jgi:uncharacterized BrkB/YihY/UPF0761 family membrane protein